MSDAADTDAASSPGTPPRTPSSPALTRDRGATDTISLPEDDPYVEAMALLPWVVANGRATLGYPLFSATLLLLAHPTASLKAMAVAAEKPNLIEHTLKTDASARLFEVLAQTAALAEPIRNWGALTRAFALARAQLSDQDLQAVAIGTDDYERAKAPLNAEAKPARPPKPAQGRRGTSNFSPALPGAPAIAEVTAAQSLMTLAQVPIAEITCADGELAFENVAYLMIVLGNATAPAERAEPTSDVRVGAALLCELTARYAGGQFAKPNDLELLAIHVPAFLGQATIPNQLVGFEVTPSGARQDLIDRAQFLFGNETVTDRLTAKRLPMMCDSLPTVYSFFSNANGPGEIIVAAARLAPLLGPAQPGRGLLQLLVSYEPILAERGALLLASANEGMSIQEMVTALLAEQITVTDQIMGSRGVGAGGAAGSGTGTAHLYNDSAIARAQRHPSFTCAADAILSLDLTDNEDRLKVFEHAYKAGCVIFQRALRDFPASLRAKHPVWDVIYRVKPDHQLYFARAQSYDHDLGCVPEARREYTWCETALKCLQKGDFYAWEMTNSPGGCYAVEDLDSAAKTKRLSKEHSICLPEALRHRAKFVMNTLIAFGFEEYPNGGLSYRDMCNMAQDFLDFAQKLAEPEASDYTQTVVREFYAAERYAGQLHDSNIFCGEPADVRLSYFLPFKSQFETTLAARRLALLPLLNMRRNFPSIFLHETTQRSVPGSMDRHERRPPALTLASGQGPARPTAARARTGRAAAGTRPAARPPAGAQRSPRPPSRATPRPAGPPPRSSNKRDARGRPVGAAPSRQPQTPSRQPQTPSAGEKPGSKAGLTTFLSSTSLLLGSRVYDLGAIATHYKLGEKEAANACWPVLLSSKPGSSALALCKHPASHGGAGAPTHRRPRGFSLDHVTSNFSRPATDSERAKAPSTSRPTQEVGALA
jgi:hypothetical protein